MYRRVVYSLLLLAALLVGIGLLPQRALAASQSATMSSESYSSIVYCYSPSCGWLPASSQGLPLSPYSVNANTSPFFYVGANTAVLSFEVSAF